jgi:heptosyltransferase-2
LNQIHAPQQVAVFLPTWLGDTVMATPTLRALRSLWPAPTRFLGVGRSVLQQLLAGTPWFDDYLPWNRDPRRPDSDSPAVRAALRDRGVDTAILLPNSMTVALMAWRSGIKRRIGYARQWRGALLTERVPVWPATHKSRRHSQVDDYLGLALAMGASPPVEPRLELATDTTSETLANQIWNNLRLHQASHVVALNFGAATCSARRWPLEHCVAFARKVASESAAAVLVLCGPGEERELAAHIASAANHARVLSMADQDLSLGVSKAVIRRSNLVVTTDSGPRHIAAAFRVPSLVICGPTDPAVNFNYHPGEQAITLRLPCSPCRANDCPLGHNRCVRDITPELVSGVALRRLAEGAARRAA